MRGRGSVNAIPWASTLLTAEKSSCPPKEDGLFGVKPATSGVTGRRSNQLNYAPEPEHCTTNESPLPCRGA
jgi:hypothetical protein